MASQTSSSAAQITSRDSEVGELFRSTSLDYLWRRSDASEAFDEDYKGKTASQLSSCRHAAGVRPALEELERHVTEKGVSIGFRELPMQVSHGGTAGISREDCDAYHKRVQERRDAHLPDRQLNLEVPAYASESTKIHCVRIGVATKNTFEEMDLVIKKVPNQEPKFLFMPVAKSDISLNPDNVKDSFDSAMAGLISHMLDRHYMDPVPEARAKFRTATNAAGLQRVVAAAS